jgi:deazaflavin-dependent oxidoreductase (nitroreductase family)
MQSAHRFALWITRGGFGWTMGGMPVIELTTTGRKSGEARTTMLTSPIQEGDTFVVVASRGGDDRHPGWFLNLRDNPNVELIVRGGPRRAATARVASDAERARLWPLITRKYPNYGGYQEKTDRVIPLVLLQPKP